MKLEHTGLPPFLTYLPKLLKVAFHSGTRFLESKGYRLRDIDGNPVAKDIFVRGCHQGYDRVQKTIGSLVLDIERRIRDKSESLKQLRQSRDAGANTVELQIAVLKDRQLLLRRIIDMIVFAILGPNEWILRRLGEEKIKSIDPRVLRRTLEIASLRHRQNPYRFSLVTDLSTMVHLGDLIEVEWTPGTGKQWRLIEVKEGKVNWKIMEIVEETPNVTALQKAEEILKTLGPRGLKQAQRMAKQQMQLAELGKILETDRGVDFRTKQEIVLNRDVITVEDYCAEINKVVVDAAERGVAAKTVDGSLHLLAVRSDLIPDKFSVAHSVFHLANPEEPCKLLDKDEFQKEVQTVTAMKAPVFDLVDLTMRTGCGYPIFHCFGIPEDKMLDLLAGRIRIFAQFDVAAFLRLAAGKGLTMTPVVGSAAEDLRKISREIPGLPGARGVQIEKPNGDTHTLLVGFFSRPFYYFTRPSELLRMAKNFPDVQVNSPLLESTDEADPKEL